MRIPSIKNKITNFLDNRKYNKEQKFINKYVKIHSNNNHDAFTQIDEAAKTIANYASNKGVTIDIYDVERVPELTNNTNRKLMLEVTNLSTGKCKNKILEANTNKTYHHVEDDYFVVDDPYDGIQLVRLTKHDYEDNFLKYLYRNIENLTNKLNGKK